MRHENDVRSEFKCKLYKHLGSPNLATIAKFDEIVKIGGCTQLPTGSLGLTSSQAHWGGRNNIEREPVPANIRCECQFSPVRLCTPSLMCPCECGLYNNNNGPNGHLFFYVGGDLMMRRGMLPIIMLPDGDLRIVLHLVPFWILTIWGSVHIEETVVG